MGPPPLPYVPAPPPRNRAITPAGTPRRASPDPWSSSSGPTGAPPRPGPPRPGGTVLRLPPGRPATARTRTGPGGSGRAPGAGPDSGRAVRFEPEKRRAPAAHGEAGPGVEEGGAGGGRSAVGGGEPGLEGAEAQLGAQDAVAVLADQVGHGHGVGHPGLPGTACVCTAGRVSPGSGCPTEWKEPPQRSLEGPPTWIPAIRDHSYGPVRTLSAKSPSNSSCIVMPDFAAALSATA